MTENLDFEKGLSQILQSVQAGPEAFNNQELVTLSTDINLLLKKTTELDVSKQAVIIFPLWRKIFGVLAVTRLAPLLAADLDEKLFYSFGSALNQKQNKASEELTFLIHAYLDIFRQSKFLQKLKLLPKWEQLILELIEKSNFNFKALFMQRYHEYKNKPLFQVISGNNVIPLSWSSVHEQVNRYAAGLLKLQMECSDDGMGPVAFIMENSIEMAMLDIASLISGVVNIMIPANSVPQQIEFILKETHAPIVVAFDDKQLSKLKSLKYNLPFLNTVVLARGSSVEEWVITLHEMVEQGSDLPEDTLVRRQSSLKTDSLATIMYTSGTTGEPKGIMFSHLNIVYKRFCRAMALPKISDEDRFLAYLPLYHTFGRWLEMTGAIFWGAEYAFMENPALATMIDNMKRIRPTIFISIPKKWYQLYEHVAGQVDVEFDEDEVIRNAVQVASGGELKWGLSAAGYLEPDIFKFFQRNGVELMSGFGMTEATGGITMTYPEEYVEGSLGKPLPGVEVMLADDGEMLIRGSYVMLGYYDQRHSNPSFQETWFPTGDIMRQDDQGFYEIIDRKKEIYKNIKGETIAPQKIENLFRDFEYVHQVFLVGDHKQFNTILIYPDFEAHDGGYKSMNEEERQNYFSTIVVTVNKFLAPFERIVDYRIVERPFSLENGELTPKGTYKRRIIEKNFSAIIDTMYTKNFISLFRDGFEIRIPNWFLREKGCLAGDIQLTSKGLEISKYRQVLEVSWKKSNPNIFQIGDYWYFNNHRFIDFQILIANPFYWLGNEALTKFTGDSIFQWYRLDAPHKSLFFYRIHQARQVAIENKENLQAMLSGGEISLFGMNMAIRHLQSPLQDEMEQGVEYLRRVLADDQSPIFDLAREMVRHPGFCVSIEAKRQFFRIGTPHFSDQAFGNFLEKYVIDQPFLLNQEVIKSTVGLLKGSGIIISIHTTIKSLLANAPQDINIKSTAVPSLLTLLVAYGIHHPTRYKRIRQLIVRYQLRKDIAHLSAVAGKSRRSLLKGFREWLGVKQQVSVDIETGKEYHWKDVIIFDEGIAPETCKKITDILTETALLRESIFLFSNGNMIRLYDIPLGGIWISPIDERDIRSTYRLSVQTRFQGSYDIKLVLSNQPVIENKKEINWMIHAGAPAKGLRLLEDFGGYWEAYNAWTQEFTTGDRVSQVIRRMMRRDSEESRDRIYHLWPFFVRTAMAAHMSFWKRTGFKLELVDKSINNISIPPHDYQTGFRLASVSDRKKCMSLISLIEDFHEQFVDKTVGQYSFLKYDYICEYIFSGILDAEGERNGLLVLKEAEIKAKKQNSKLSEKLNKFIKEIEKNHFVSKQMFFAINRFHRWFSLNSNAAFSAQARMINEMYETYQLDAQLFHYPASRTRFYLETVFADSNEKFKTVLRGIIVEQHERRISHEETLKLISVLEKEQDLSEKEKFFLSRLSYPHLKPTDTAALVSTLSEGTVMADVVVRLEDYDGMSYLIRKPVSPKEISRLHHLFLETNLPVNFHPEHRFLVAISEREHIIGGLFFSKIEQDTVHMEKIVVSGRYRRKGISEGLMNEFFNRLRDEHFQYVTTGFFRPEYFYRFDFKIERKYAGLVKDLTKENKKSETEI